MIRYATLSPRYISSMRMLLSALMIVGSLSAVAQSPLQQQIASIAVDAEGKVSVACSLPDTKLDCDYNPHAHVPMQSVFKFPLAIAVLEQVEAGKLSLDQQVRFLPSDRYPGSYSPLQDAHPGANVDVPLRELLRLSVSLSDNIATDILLRLIGGTKTVQRTMDALGFRSIHVVDTEAQMHDNKTLQYRDYAEPAAMVRLLRMIADRSPLTPADTKLLNEWMEGLVSSPKRIRGMLPAGTVVAHKSGTSGIENGMAAATNDVGLITLPDGRRLAIAIFVTDSHADAATGEAVIARIAKVAYDEALTAAAK
jgi:beta-lactamase class A